MYLVIAVVVVVLAVALPLLTAMFLRKVVPTNEVHIVQSSKKSISFGTGLEAGNTYYHWPAWVPVIGVRVVSYPVSVFGQELVDYEAYDSGRLPFMVDVKAFFRINDSAMASKRVSSFMEMNAQLKDILRGSIRTILARHSIEEIMEGRSQFGIAFTTEVDAQLKEWGVSTVKSIELMDIRDSKGSEVIKNIMEKKKSLIEMESRVEVAGNKKTAEIAETDAGQLIELRKQEALQAVGIRKAEAQQQVGIATEKSSQAVKEQAALTAEKDMAVRRINDVKTAEILKDVQILAAEQQKATAAIIAEGALKAKRFDAEGIQVEGEARANAEKAMLLAPVDTQITLAKEIGSNESYQAYLTNLAQIEANKIVGLEQAKALAGADVKIIANTGDPVSGAGNVMDLFTPAGGTKLGGMVEALAQSPAGAALVQKFLTPKA